MKYRATLTVDEDAEELERLFRAEDREMMKSRASYELTTNGDAATFEVKAEDATALRAVMDSIAKGLKAYEDAKEV